jgi:hypothetical protein
VYNINNKNNNNKNNNNKNNKNKNNNKNNNKTFDINHLSQIVQRPTHIPHKQRFVTAILIVHNREGPVAFVVALLIEVGRQRGKVSIRVVKGIVSKNEKYNIYIYI